MAENGKVHQTVIKKYANRRLYHTGTSTYVTLEDLSTMVQGGEDFVVYDARSGDDITRSVLTQIIFEQENKAGDDNLLPVAFLRQLIRFYGDSMRTMVPSFLEFSMANFARDQDGLREKLAQSFGPTVFQQAIEQQVRANMSFFGDAMKMFTHFGAAGPGGQPGLAPPATPPAVTGPSDIDDLKRQMAEMHERLEALARK
ncbi:polyhydroxyalkanoate synthesis repressor PhaR [Methylobacterium sp. sgz302541]|uniref:polyhydroxyalkanoate synthesis repressor PhaR n=1 Tax=unclassified Methylobacterium TaxID=2615210 RepID=UPI003D348D48